MKLHTSIESVQGIDGTLQKRVRVSLSRAGFQDLEAGADTQRAGPLPRAALEPGSFLAGVPGALHVHLACPPDVLVCSQRHDAHNSPRHLSPLHLRTAVRAC